MQGCDECCGHKWGGSPVLRTRSHAFWIYLFFCFATVAPLWAAFCLLCFFLFCFCRTIVGGFFVLPFVDPKLCEDKVALKKALRG